MATVLVVKKETPAQKAYTDVFGIAWDLEPSDEWSAAA
jgi:hypothetical protein